jgi:hypothetical protein
MPKSATTTKSAAKPRQRVQTTRINGAKVRLVTNAAGKITIKAAPIDEWELQAAAVRALKAMPGYAETADDVTPHASADSFTIAGDMNGDYRSKQAAVKAKATGIAAGDPDLRVYASGGRLLLIEYKGEEGRLSVEQRDRHALLRSLGYRVEVIKAVTREECAAVSVELVSRWLSSNHAPS